MRRSGLVLTLAAFTALSGNARAEETGSNTGRIVVRVVVLPACATPDRPGNGPACNFSAERRLPLIETRSESTPDSGAKVVVVTYTP
jgi:hypothetical protein